jgi:hypothetical protein
MTISLPRRRWLADRLRELAAEEEARGFNSVAAEFRMRARKLEVGLDPTTAPKRHGQPHEVVSRLRRDRIGM